MLDCAWSFLWMREMLTFRQEAGFQEVIERFGLTPCWEQFGPPDGHELRRGKLLVS